MAVEAQHPSHVLFLNRNEQERKNMEYSLQAQAAGFLDQSSSSALFFSSPLSINGGSSNTRKRGRDAAAAPTVANTPLQQQPINLFSLQPQPPSAPPPPTTTTLINLSQLHTQSQPQPNTFVSTGLRLSFEDHQQQQQQQQQQKQGNTLFSSFLTEDLAAEIKQQKDEIDQFLQSQGEQLRRMLAESQRRHFKVLLRLAEESAARRLREKQAEVDSAARRNAELAERVGRLRAESMAWQVKARAEEATAATLQVQLQQVAQDNHNRGEKPGCGGETPAADAESAYVDPERREVVGSSGPLCRACRRRVVGVLLLPCRHLCLCRECGAGVEACPVCFSVRSACVEVFLS